MEHVKSVGQFTRNCVIPEDLIFNDVDESVAISTVKKGAFLVKHGRRGLPHKRFFFISNDEKFLRWQSPRKDHNQTTIDLTIISRLQRGQKTAVFQRHPNSSKEGLSFSIIYNNRSLDLICEDEDRFKLWVTGITVLIKRNLQKLMEDEDEETRYFHEEWKKSDVDNNERLSFDEVVTLLNRLNIRMPKADIKNMFKMIDRNGSNNLEFDEFRQLLNKLRERPEIFDIYKMFTDGQDFMSAESFLRFLQQEQGQSHMTLEQARRIMRGLPKGNDSQLSFSAFSYYINSLDNSILSPEKNSVYQDMTRPLSHYYIASSHNTYLEGDQLAGRSSVNQYVTCLLRGCRCVELDCWDGPDGEPIIYHGHTLTSKIKFQDVIEACKNFGFRQSPYPVVLSLEMHCSLPQQVRIAEILRSVLGESLYTLPPNADTMAEMPSPDSLKYKFLVKGKRASGAHVEPEDDSDGEEEDENAPVAPASGKALKASKSKAAGGHSHAIAPELSALVFLGGVKFKGFATPRKIWEMSSLSEGKVSKLIGNSASSLVAFHNKYISRIYPAGTRVDSSNYDPCNSWAVGAQMVALNYQTTDLPVIINEGKFLENGGAYGGYVLKPQFMLDVPEEGAASSFVSPAGPYDAANGAIVSGRSKRIRVHVISGQQIPKPNHAQKGEVIDPYVVVGVYGHPADRSECRTSVVDDNGFNPRWDKDTPFEFSLSCPDIDVLVFQVYDKDFIGADDFICHYALPVSCLRTGYRKVPLIDKAMHIIPFSSLFCRITVEDL